MSILKAVYHILKYPPVGDITDPVRLAAAQAITDLNPGVFVHDKPADAPRVCITIEYAGGEPPQALGGSFGWTTTAVDVRVWAKLNTNRALAEVAQTLAKDVTTLLNQFRGTSAGVEIVDAMLTTEVIQLNEAPRAKSDDWTTALLMPFEFVHEATRASAEAVN